MGWVVKVMTTILLIKIITLIILIITGIKMLYKEKQAGRPFMMKAIFFFGLILCVSGIFFLKAIFDELWILFCLMWIGSFLVNYVFTHRFLPIYYDTTYKESQPL
jgi:hypothetical protein